MSAEEFTGVGFASGSIRGTRSFRVDQLGRLSGIHYRQVWTPGENKASCRRDPTTMSIQQAFWQLTSVAPLPPRPSFSQRMGLTPFAAGGVIPRAAFGSSHDPVPDADQHEFASCGCGFYGYYEGSDDYHDARRVSAVVEAYGEAVIGTRGFRAMKARILALTIREGLDGLTAAMARKVTTNYPDVAVFDSFDSMVSEFPPDPTIEPSPSTDPEFWTRNAGDW